MGTENWQLKIYGKAIKKKVKVRYLNKFMHSTLKNDCLDIGCGNGVLSYFLRKRGGNWISTDSNEECVKESNKLLDGNVRLESATSMSFDSNSFDCVVALDLIEHVENVDDLIKEVARVLKPGGYFYLTTPNIAGWLPLNKLKDRIGVTPESYGHTIAGYTPETLNVLLNKNNLELVDHTTYSKFFTESIELALNYFYKKSKKGASTEGYIKDLSPGSSQDFNNVPKAASRAYAVVYPFLRLFSGLDKLLGFARGYALLAKIKKIDS